MTLGQFATAVGARPRWVLNALTRLKVPRRYSERLARRLCLARLLAEDVGMTLAAAYRMAGKALEEADPSGTWRHESLNAAMRSGKIYTNVHSLAFPGGVARGQVFAGRLF